MKIEGRTFIVSGGSSGLGLGLSTYLLSHHASVSILDLSPPPPSSPLSSSPNILYTRTDVSSTPSIVAAIRATVAFSQRIGHPLGGIIPCAGVAHAERALPRQDPNAKEGEVKTMSMPAFDRTLTINLRGTVDLITQALPYLAAVDPRPPDGERGVVVVVSSVAAYEGQVGQLAYAASKGAVASIVLPLARELGRTAGIRVCGVAPGVMESGMTVGEGGIAASNGEAGEGEQLDPAAMAGQFMKAKGMVEWPPRMGRPEEFARLVGECIGNGMLNGVVVRLDGGVRFPARL